MSRGHEVSLLSGAWPGAPSHDLVDGVSITRVPGILGLHCYVPLFLRRAGSVEIIVSDLSHVLPWGTHLFSRIPFVNYFRHLHARTLRGQVGPFLARALMAVETSYRLTLGQGKVVTETEFSRDDLVRLGIDRSRVRVIPPGVDLRTFNPGTMTPEPTLVYFAGMRRYKRPEHALQLLSRLRSRGIVATLDFIGDGPSMANLKQLVAENRLTQFVRFWGHVSDRQLVEIVRRAWINVICTQAEGWGLTAIEAAACGVPTVAYSVPGIRTTVMDGISGRLAPSGNVDSLTEAAVAVMAARNELGAKCRRFAEDFSWESTVRSWECLLREELSTANAPDTG